MMIKVVASKWDWIKCSKLKLWWF